MFCVPAALLGQTTSLQGSRTPSPREIELPASLVTDQVAEFSQSRGLQYSDALSFLPQ